MTEQVCNTVMIPVEEYNELRERCAFYERTNAEQGKLLNQAIAERYQKAKKIAEGIKYRQGLRGFFVPEDIRDLLAAITEAS